MTISDDKIVEAMLDAWYGDEDWKSMNAQFMRRDMLATLAVARPMILRQATQAVPASTMRSAEEVRAEIEYQTKSAMAWKETNGPIAKGAGRDCEVRASVLCWVLNEQETGR